METFLMRRWSASIAARSVLKKVLTINPLSASGQVISHCGTILSTTALIVAVRGISTPHRTLSVFTFLHATQIAYAAAGKTA